jgi:predicted small metal-binding protein
MSDHTHPPARHFACGRVVPGCTFTVTAPTEEELLKQVAGHAAEVHGITEITPALVSQVQAAIETR